MVRNELFKLLAERGTLLTNYKAITHPSQPNYLGGCEHLAALLSPHSHLPLFLYGSCVCATHACSHDLRE